MGIEEDMKEGQAREADAADKPKSSPSSTSPTRMIQLARNMMGASTGTDAQDSEPVLGTDKYILLLT